MMTMPLMEENVSITQLERTKSTHPYFENAVGLHNRRPSRNHTTTGKEASSFVPSPSNDQDQDEQIEMFFEEDEIHAADQNQEGDKRKREIAQPSDCDVICIKCKMTKTHPGNKFYRSLVEKHRLEIQKLNRPPLMGERVTAAKEIMRTIREKGGKFLFKFKQDAMWYDIGNKQANRKTSLLLETACRMGKPQDQKNGCHLEDEHELTPEVLEKLADISRSKLSSKQRVQELMKLLVIPPAIDPLAWELELQRKRRANSTTTTNATAFHHHPFPELVKSSSSPPNDIILLDDDIVSNDKRRVSKRKASLPDHHYRHPVKQPRFPSAVNCRRQSDYSRNDDSEPVPELVGSVL